MIDLPARLDTILHQIRFAVSRSVSAAACRGDAAATVKAMRAIARELHASADIIERTAQLCEARDRERAEADAARYADKPEEKQ